MNTQMLALRRLQLSTATGLRSVLLLTTCVLTTGCPEDDLYEARSAEASIPPDADLDGHPDGVDCDDADPTVFPGAADDWYDGIDSDCAGDDDYDADLDGYDVGVDCDDADPTISPGAVETWYDGVDQNCDGEDDYDLDGDGHELASDCDDTDPTVHPYAPDGWYDGIDSDCMGNDDFDADADGWGVDEDCDESDPSTYPGAPDAWYDGVDSNCWGDDDNDADGDGHGLDTDCDDHDANIGPDAPDAWYDGVDSDCAGNDDDDADGDGYGVFIDCDDTDPSVYFGSSAACPADETALTVLATSPDDLELDAATTGAVYVYFSEDPDPLSLSSMTFLLTADGVSVAGSVTVDGDTATFTPNERLSDLTLYEATVTTGVTDYSGNPLAVDYLWSFTTGATDLNSLPVNLGTAGTFAILAKTGISTVPTSAITGDIGVSPAAATYITGFSLTADATNVFSTSPQVSGQVFAADYAVPTPSNLTTAVSDMETAFTDAASRAPDVTELGAGNIGGMTLEPGVYKWGTGVLIPTDLTLSGTVTDVWIFEIAQDLTVSNGTQVVLSGGATPANVFWQVAGLVDIGTTAHMEGIVLSQTAITLGTGASVNGRLLAQTAVNIDSSVVSEP